MELVTLSDRPLRKSIIVLFLEQAACQVLKVVKIKLAISYRSLNLLDVIFRNIDVCPS